MGHRTVLAHQVEVLNPESEDEKCYKAIQSELVGNLSEIIELCTLYGRKVAVHVVR